MRYIYTISLMICISAITPQRVHADYGQFNNAVIAVQENCTGIYDKLAKVKTMAGINTAVTGVGTLVGGGALYAGISKSKIDKKIKELEDKLANIENMSDQEFIKFLKDSASYEEAITEYNTICTEKKALENKSKKLGNVRTGLMAGNTATAVAGTIIANKNKNDGKSIVEHVQLCLGTMHGLTIAIGQAQIDGEKVKHEKLTRIYDACSKMYTRNLGKISKNSNAAMISSAINIGTGTVGTITSALANTDAIHRDNSESNQKKEQNLNNAANILAGTSTVASGVSTVFNALTLKAINDNIRAAQECEEALRQ